MRTPILIVLALVAAAPAWAQVNPLRYRPLDVGDSWTYVRRDSAFGASGTTVTVDHLIARIVGDTLIGGQAWRVAECARVGLDGTVLGTNRYAVRRGATVTQPLDQVTVVNADGCRIPGSDHYLPATETTPATVQIGGIAYPVAGERALPFSFNCVPTGTSCGGYGFSYASDIGIYFDVYSQTSCGILCAPATGLLRILTLRYAVVGGIVYGSDPLASDPPPVVPGELAVVPAPNPARSTLGLRLAFPEAAAAWVDVFDALGRRVHAADLGVQSAGAVGLRLDVAEWAAGPYVVRVMTERGVSASARVTVAR